MAGRYKAYPEYKDSDEEWLSTMPIHWEWSKVSWSFRAEKGKNGQLLTKEYCGRKKGEFPVYSGQTENGGVMGTIDTYEFDSGVKGVLFSTTVGAKAMHLTHLKGKFSLSQNCMIIMPMVSLDVRYCFYHFQPLFAHERSLIPDHMQASFRMEDLYQYKIILPPLPEQKQIAKFLDNETGKIDALIAKQQALIALLKEKRQAVISHAVTKGLNPDARMKDSGVEWLGDVPEHWEPCGLKHRIELMIDNRGRSPRYYDEGTPILEARHILAEQLHPDRSFDKFINHKDVPDFVRDDIKEGDVLFITVGTVGKVALVDANPEYAILQNIVGLRFDKETSSRFMHHLLTSDEIKFAMNAHNKNSILDSIKISDFIQTRIELPPLEEQNSIGAYLSEEDAKVEKLTEKAIQAIDLMQERRTALISAAVTGKIDVRSWTAPEEPVQKEEV